MTETTDELTLEQLSQLEDQAIEGSTDADYVPPSDFSRPPTPGVFTMQQVITEAEPLKSGRSITKDGKLMAWWNFKTAILGGPFDGRTSYQGVNTYVGVYRPGCSAADMIRSAGRTERPATVPEYEALLGRAEVGKITKKSAGDGPRTEIPIVPPLTPIAPKTNFKFTAKTTWEWTDGEGTVFLRGYANPTSPKKYAGPKITPRMVKVKEGDKEVRVADATQVGPDGAEYGARLVITDFVVGDKTKKTTTPGTKVQTPAEG